MIWLSVLCPDTIFFMFRSQNNSANDNLTSVLNVHTRFMRSIVCRFYCPRVRESNVFILSLCLSVCVSIHVTSFECRSGRLTFDRMHLVTQGGNDECLLSNITDEMFCPFILNNIIMKCLCVTTCIKFK